MVVVKDKLTKLADWLNAEIDKEYEMMPLSNMDSIRKNAYAYGLQKALYGIENIIAGREFNDYGE